MIVCPKCGGNPQWCLCDEMDGYDEQGVSIEDSHNH